MKLTPREKEVMEAIVTIGRNDICMKEIAYSMGISYAIFMRHRNEAMHRNGYTIWEGFVCDYVKEENP